MNETRVDPSKKPQFCDLILLENCMLRCKMCNMWQCRNDINRVPTSFYQKFIESLYEHFGSDMQIQFVGGEPLLKPGIIDLIRSASKKGYFTSLTSNGFLINRRMAFQLIDAGISSLALSLDSIDKKVHDHMRGRHGVYKRVMKALKYLAQYRYPEQSICVVSTITSMNIDGLVALADWAEENNDITCITFQVLSQPFYTPEDPNWYTNDQFSSLVPKDMEKVKSIIDALIERKEKKNKIGNSVNQLAMFKKYFENPGRFVKKGGCHLGYNSLSVNSSGDISICFEQEPLGNIMRDTIKDVWESTHASDVRKSIKACSQNCKLMINCFSEEGFSV